MPSGWRRPATPFAPDTPWQHELEASFPFVETEDQLRAVREVKTDMERPGPMDRLICGEVGYGKTEVALRAAFKAVMGGKQVALLVPTTVLAQQHYDTFHASGLAPFPVKVEMLSRFRTNEEQRAILPLLATARLTSSSAHTACCRTDVAFKNLGLVIIDEEQRFGVTHKEHLKRADAGGCADADGHADPAHAVHEPDRRARHHHDPDAARRTAADHYACWAV